MEVSAKHAAILLLPIALVACLGNDDSRSISYTDDRGVGNQRQPVPHPLEALQEPDKSRISEPVQAAVLHDLDQMIKAGRQRIQAKIDRRRYVTDGRTLPELHDSMLIEDVFELKRIIALTRSFVAHARRSGPSMSVLIISTEPVAQDLVDLVAD